MKGLCPLCERSNLMVICTNCEREVLGVGEGGEVLGWDNYPTSRVVAQFDDVDDAQYWIDETMLAWASARRAFSVPRASQGVRTVLARRMRSEWAQEWLDGLLPGSPALDLVEFALNLVNWEQVADAFLSLYVDEYKALDPEHRSSR